MDDRAGLATSPPEVTPPKPERRVEPDSSKGGDVYKWSVEQVALIRAGRYDAIDWANVADEIESVGNSEFRSLSSNIEVVLTHMLKWDHQATRRTRSWSLSINEHRQRVATDLADSPSLKSRLDEAIERAYRLGRLVAARETDLPLRTFAKACPYDWDAITNRPFPSEKIGATE